MKTLAKKLSTAATISLIAVSVYLQTASANSNYVPDLKAQIAVADTRISDGTQISMDNSAPQSDAAADETVLYGNAKKHQSLDGAATDASANADAEKSGLQSETPESAQTRANMFQLAAKKLSSGSDLNADDIRQLQIGCVGMEVKRTFFQNVGEVEAVYPDSPAAEAGIKVGDKVLDNSNDDEAKKDPTQPLWQVTLAQAGTTQTVTLLKHKKPVVITLTRMNIEDIQDKKIRKMWENMAKNLVNSNKGTFMARSVKDLEHPERGRNMELQSNTETWDGSD